MEIKSTMVCYAWYMVLFEIGSSFRSGEAFRDWVIFTELGPFQNWAPGWGRQRELL